MFIYRSCSHLLKTGTSNYTLEPFRQSKLKLLIAGAELNCVCIVYKEEHVHGSD